ncbi:hypothetical protein V1J52_16360 [Streptomyces sp. TRM 70351]|uniref:golvesin C-terminal-like domain-containing protein n=1 Tax=Streptomyces sp. TRM 70351 TaxID=3116552 RepID=UPI002E7BD7CE|nr:hypothetical protein [Streptomyces sp. TRM 70351]MEE1929740.1 hypothetical protein [Streptomyces sp. TRM 70351]
MAAIAAGAMFTGLFQGSAWAREKPAPPQQHQWAETPGEGRPGDAPDEVPASRRSDVLGKDWRKSGDLAWTTTGDARGFHLLSARQSDGYAWQTTASLSEPGFDADMWIGNACVTGSGERAVVVYAPRTFTNDARLMARGGFTAVVELDSGTVTKLDLQASLSHYNPGCGVDESAVLTQSGGEDKAATRLVRLDAASGELSEPVETKGQVTSAVPAADGSIVAAAGAQVVKVAESGERTALADTDGVPYYLTPDAEGGVVFLDKTPAARQTIRPRSGPVREDAAPRTRAKRLTPAQVRDPQPGKAARTALAEGLVTGTGLTRSAAGTVYVTGEKTAVPGKLPKAVRSLAGTPQDATVTTGGEAVVTRTAWADGKDSRVMPEDAAQARPVDVTLKVLGTGKDAEFTVDPATAPAPHAAQGGKASPKNPAGRVPVPGAGVDGAKPKPEKAARDEVGGPRPQLGLRAPLAAVPAADRTEIVESERYCSVPRNDPRNQAVQPKPRQVEWAVNRAVRGELNSYVSRPANWKNLGMPAYSPQSLFPRVPLDGGGYVPHQVMLGITAAESNMQQASRVAVPGVSANPTIGNYYGIDYYDGQPLNDWDIDWPEADCGYGVTQVTDHMRRAGKEDGGLPAWDYAKQRAVALDYTVNIAAGLQILSKKWNQTRQAGLIANNGNVEKIENWYFALWAYNSGFYPDKGDGSPWGVGWANNPANPEWDAGRTPFMEDWFGNEEPHDAAHPQDWPYQEKVIGFAAHPPAYLEAPGTMVPAFRASWWNGTGGDATIPGSAKNNRAGAKAPEDLFCSTANDCDPDRISDGASNDAGAGPCTRSDFKCWWNQPVEWKDDCDYSCGNHYRRFPDGWAEEPDGNAYPPLCDRGNLPAAARIIDDVPDGTPSIRPGCARFWHNAGTFTLDFGAGESGGHPSNSYLRWPGKVDTHQLGAGFGSHFYFTHTRGKDDPAKAERLKVTASWKFSGDVDGPARVWVHMPDHGAQTSHATYRVKTAKGTKTRTVQQDGETNRWVNIGAFLFDGKPEVSLNSVTKDGTGDDNIAFDAVAVEPFAGSYKEHTVDAVALFDEDQNIDGDQASGWLVDSPFESRQKLYDWAHGLASSVTGIRTCASGENTPACVRSGTKQAMSAWKQQIEAAGTHPTNHPDGNSLARWIGFANSYQDRPTSDALPSHFLTDDERYKIRSRAKVSFIAGPDGKVIEGSEEVSYSHRTGDTHLPEFLFDVFDALEDDYGIAPPDLTYATEDLNVHDGRTRTVYPNTSHIIPGRAYAYAGKAPTITEDGECVAAMYTSGGSIGYRPMIGEGSAARAVDAWARRVQSTQDVPAPVFTFALEVLTEMFSSGGLGGPFTGSLFGQAAPIWQELNFRACSDGSLETNNRPILRYSHMPDQYLYHNGRAVDQDGDRTFSKEPVNKGNFVPFSRLPDPNVEFPLWENPFGPCGPATGKSGNPWDMTSPQSPSANPANAHFCVDRDLPSDPEYSS